MKVIHSIAVPGGKKQIVSVLAGLVVMLAGGLGGPAGASGQTASFTACINNTVDEGQCKDCCDSLDDPTERKICRDACAVNDFSTNTDFITVDAPSVLGPDGDYSRAVATGSEQDCKTYCDESEELAAGDRRFCRDACNASEFEGKDAWDSQDSPAVEGGPENGGGSMTIEQTLSDQAQATTIAFDALAFLTGDLCSDTFLPPGKVADFSGFQYLRDNDPTGMGHNTDFVTIIAFNMMNLLSENQLAELVTLAEGQIAMINAYAYKRFPLMKAFRRLLAGDLPEGAEGLDMDAVTAYSAELYRLDGRISYGRAQVLGGILRNLTIEQQTELDILTALGGIGNWDRDKADPLRELYPGLSHDEHVAVMTYASEMYSWYAGSVAADTYFCPERQGTYFGSFYMKDMPAMGNADFTIPDNLTAEMGDRFLAALTDLQAQQVTALVEIQRTALAEIVEVRSAISNKLRDLMVKETVDEAEVLALAERYGELDGEIVYSYAVHFAGVSGTLTAEQALLFASMRSEWNTVACEGAYLYSEPVEMPEIMDTDFLFAADDFPAPDQPPVTLPVTEGPAADNGGDLPGAGPALEAHDLAGDRASSQPRTSA